MNFKHLYHQKKLRFLHKMLRSNNSIVASVMKFFIHWWVCQIVWLCWHYTSW